jgi:hypothetical protein
MPSTDIHYKFIFSPNNSGTTVMSQYLAAHLPESYLPPFGNNEGQMAPNVISIMRSEPWNPDSLFDWKAIKNEWDTLATREGKSVFIECSPPNILRVSKILATFPNSEYVFSISSPYSYIASHLFNYAGKSRLRKGVATEESFANYVDLATNIWINKAKVQKNNIELHGSAAKRITYEEFCANPPKLLRCLGIAHQKRNSRLPVITGKANTEIGEIINMLPKHLSFLGIDGISRVNSLLSGYRDLVEWHGYNFLSLTDSDSVLSENILLALDGQRRRICFDQRIRKY